jgi:hypothetical protein
VLAKRWYVQTLVCQSVVRTVAPRGAAGGRSLTGSLGLLGVVGRGWPSWGSSGVEVPAGGVLVDDRQELIRGRTMVINHISGNLDYLGDLARAKALTAFNQRLEAARLSADVRLALIDVLAEFRGEIDTR